MNALDQTLLDLTDSEATELDDYLNASTISEWPNELKEYLIRPDVKELALSGQSTQALADWIRSKRPTQLALPEIISISASL